MSEQNLQKKVQEMRELQRMAEEISEEIENIRDEIKAEMLKRNTDEVITGEYKITWKTVISNRLDTTALKKALPDVFNSFTNKRNQKDFVLRKRRNTPGTSIQECL